MTFLDVKHYYDSAAIFRNLTSQKTPSLDARPFWLHSVFLFAARCVSVELISNAAPFAICINKPRRISPLAAPRRIQSGFAPLENPLRSLLCWVVCSAAKVVDRSQVQRHIIS